MHGEPGPAQRPAQVVFAALVVASFVAFAFTQHLKHTPTAVQELQDDNLYRRLLAAARGRRQAGEYLEYRFKIAQAGEVTVAIVDSGGKEVLTLVRDCPLARYHQLSFELGRSAVAPPRAPAPAAGTPANTAAA